MKAIKDSLKDKVAFVTGAGSGIGKAAAKMLAYAGARIAVLSDTEEEVQATARELISQGHEAIAICADISSTSAMEQAVAQVKDKWGRLDIVLADAGINGVWAPIEEITTDEWDRTQTVNLRGTFLTAKFTAPLLKAQGGSLIVIASVNGNRIFSNTGATAYSCSKAGQVAMTKMLAVEFGPHNVRVNVICPGAIATQISKNSETRKLEEIRIPVEYPKGRIPLTGKKPGTSGDVAELIWFLASDYSSHITGTEIYIDGAQSLLQG